MGEIVDRYGKVSFEFGFFEGGWVWFWYDYDGRVKEAVVGVVI